LPLEARQQVDIYLPNLRLDIQQFRKVAEGEGSRRRRLSRAIPQRRFPRFEKGREVRGLSWPELVEIPATTNPLSIKGIGESGTIGAPPTVVNAVLDALRDRGVEHLDMSLTPARIWQAANFSVKATA